MSTVASAILIRPPRSTDVEALVSLTAELGYPVTTEQLRIRLTILESRDFQIVRIAETSVGVIGWVQAERRLSLESGERVELVGLVVSSVAKRSGVGSLLVRCVEEWAQTQGVSTLVVRSNLARTESHLFYPALGFQVSKTQQVYAKILPPMQ